MIEAFDVGPEVELSLNTATYLWLFHRKVAKHEKIIMQIKFSEDWDSYNSVYESLLRDLISSLKILDCLLSRKKSVLISNTTQVTQGRQLWVLSSV